MNCLRKRIKDERFIDLIRKMLQAGVMEAGNLAPTYSGTPQGGLCKALHKPPYAKKAIMSPLQKADL
ncbi:MAG: hypothetical protein R6W86_08765 [Marinobacter sp.]|uniref:hypothetical protein n=1 Tax=Marinobacter sp. TaxID=50741 RepID=UPI00396EEFF5